MAIDPFKASNSIGLQMGSAAVNPFTGAKELRAGLNENQVELASSLYARPATQEVFAAPRFADGGLVKRVVQQQRQRALPKMAEQPKYMAKGGPVCMAEGGLVDDELQKSKNGFPDYGYGDRYQPPGDTNPSRPKAQGYYGEVQRPDGGVSTELSVDTGRGEIPALVPGLNKAEFDATLSAKEGENFPDSVYQKADSYAAFRQLNGQAPFAGVNDKQELTPVANDGIVSNALKAPNDPPYRYAEGGPVTEPRPTTMAEDTVDAKLHPDEYVIPAEVVRKKGVDFFDRLVKNAQGERKGIVPVMKGGTMYAALGGYAGNAVDEEKKKQNDLPNVRPETPAPASTNTFRAPTAEELGRTIRARDAAALDTLAQSQRSMQRTATPAPKANASDVNNPNVGASELRLYQQESAPRLAAKAAEERAAQQPSTSGVDKVVNSVKDTASNALKAVNPNNYSPEVKNEILRRGDASLDLFKKVKGGLVGAVQAAGAQLANPKNPESQKAFSSVTGFGLPKVVDTLQRKGLVGAAADAARFFSGDTERGRRVDAAIDAQDKRITDTLLFGSEGRPGAAKTTAAADTVTGAKQAVDTAQPAKTPELYTREALPDGGTRTTLTAEGYKQAFGNEAPMTPERIAAMDAADAKRLAATEAQDAGATTQGQAGFDPVEQYKQKLAADLEYQKEIAQIQDLAARQGRDYVPLNQPYGQPDNSVTTKQMELDAAKQSAQTKQEKPEKPPQNKYRPILDPVTGGVQEYAPVEGPEADAAYAAQRAQTVNNTKSNIAYNLLNNPSAIDQVPEEDRPKVLDAVKQWAASNDYKNWLLTKK